MILKYLEKLTLKRKYKRILQEQGFLVFCSQCSILLNDISYATPTPAEGVYSYKCIKCGKKTQFDLTAPVPMVISKEKME